MLFFTPHPSGSWLCSQWFWSISTCCRCHIERRCCCCSGCIGSLGGTSKTMNTQVATHVALHTKFTRTTRFRAHKRLFTSVWISMDAKRWRTWKSLITIRTMVFVVWGCILIRRWLGGGGGLVVRIRIACTITWNRGLRDLVVGGRECWAMGCTGTRCSCGCRWGWIQRRRGWKLIMWMMMMMVMMMGRLQDQIKGIGGNSTTMISRLQIGTARSWIGITSNGWRRSGGRWIEWLWIRVRVIGKGTRVHVSRWTMLLQQHGWWCCKTRCLMLQVLVKRGWTKVLAAIAIVVVVQVGLNGCCRLWNR